MPAHASGSNQHGGVLYVTRSSVHWTTLAAGYLMGFSPPLAGINLPSLPAQLASLAPDLEVGLVIGFNYGNEGR